MQLRRIALSLEGTTEAPHFDRAAFKVARIYVTIVGDGLTAYLKFTADEQELKCLTAPDAFAPVPNASLQLFQHRLEVGEPLLAELPLPVRFELAHGGAQGPREGYV